MRFLDPATAGFWYALAALNFVGVLVIHAMIGGVL